MRRSRNALVAIVLVLVVLASALIAARFRSSATSSVRASDAQALAAEPPPGAIDAAPIANREPAAGTEDDANSKDRVLEDSDLGDRAAADSGALQEPIHLHGSLVLAGAEDSEAGIVLVDRDGERKRSGSSLGRVRSYTFDGLEPGEYVLEASAEGHRRDRRAIVLRAGEPDHREDFTLATIWVLDVHVETPDGEDLARSLKSSGTLAWVAVFATTEPPGETLPKTFSLDRQELSIGTPSYGKTFVGLGGSRRIEIASDPPIFVSAAMREQVLATQRIDTRVPEIRLVVDPARAERCLAGLTLVVVDGETGAPAVRASVQLRTIQLAERAIQPDDHGRVTFERRMPGLYEVQILMPDRPLTTLTADLALGRTTDLGTVRLEKGFEIRGRCVDERGADLQDVLPGLQRSDDDSNAPRAPVTIIHAEKDDERGGFVFKGMPPGRYVIVENPPRFPRDEEPRERRSFVPVVVDVRKGPVQDLVLVAGRPMPLILRPTSDGLDGVRFEVRTPGGLLVRRGEFRGKVPERIEIASGEYRLVITWKDAPVRETPFVLDAGLLPIDVDP